MKKLKRIFSLFLVLTIGVLGITLSSPEAKADTGDYLKFTIGGSDYYGESATDYVVGTKDSLSPNLPISVFVNQTSTGDNSVFGDVSYPADNGIKIVSNQAIQFWVGEQQFTGTPNQIYTIIWDRTVGSNVVLYKGDITYDDIEGEHYEYPEDYLSNNYQDGIYLRFESDKRPAISGEENFVTNVDDAKPISFFQAFLSAYDETDGDLTDDIYIITDNYTANRSNLGVHKVIFGVEDSSGNEATLEVYIRVVDITNPIINGNSSVAKIGYKETWNISNFKTTLTVTDNYDTLTHNDVTVKNDGYTSNKTKLGTYNIVFAVKDNSNNEGTFTKQIQVYDNVKPNISGPTEIATSNNTILTEADVRAQLTASDEIDGNLTSKIEKVSDNYTGNGNKVGTYTITYRVVDNAGNVGEHTVSITRSDRIPPTFWIEDKASIKTTPTTPLTFEQLILILEETGQVTVNATTTFSTIWEDYTGNEDVPGIYTWGVKARSTDGNSSDTFMTISVLDVQDEDGVEVNPDLTVVEWIKENPVISIIGAAVLLAAAVWVSKKFFKK